jgi:hypothetical protein
MIDPHVEELHYKVVKKQQTDYGKAAPLKEENDDFMMTLNGSNAIFVMKKHFPSEEEARAVVDEYIKRWEIIIGIEHGPDALKLVFEKSKMIDRAPPSEKGHVIHAKSAVHAITGLSAKLTVCRSEYPSLPEHFALSTDVETMYLRYKAYKEKRETLLSMAFLCLTVLEASTGYRGKVARRKAAKQYRIDFGVMDKLGALTSAWGAKEEARKAPSNGQFKPLSGPERAWIEAVIKSLIRRAGELAFNPSADLKEIRMEDLPPLK